jgi:type 1 glutamine amidotransferase
MRSRRHAAFSAIAATAALVVLVAIAASVASCGPRAAARHAVLGAAGASVKADEQGSSAPAATPASAAAPPAAPRVLVFSRTLGFRHKSIPDGVAALREIGEGRWETDATEDAAAFTADNLRRYAAVVFLSTTGNVLDAEQQRAFEGYIRGGGGWAGVHAAADTEYDWPWYGRLAGAWFLGHPKIQPATVRVEDRTHRSTMMLPAEWVRTDEWYSFRRNPRADVRVLATLDERTYDPEKTPMGADHPIAWYHEFEGGRAWYTAGGHTAESFREPLFREHLRGGIEWTMGAAAPAPGAPAGKPAPAPAAGSARVLGGNAAAILAQVPAGGLPTAAILAIALGIAAVVAGTTGQGVRAPLLSLAFPGLGHLSLGYRRRGLLAMAGVLGMFLTGLAIGGVDAVDSVEDAPWFIAQGANGPIAFGADIVNQRVLKTGKAGELLPTQPPTDALGRPAQGSFSVSSLKGVGAANEFGTLFIALGGMLNFILVLDASRRQPAARPGE